MKLVIRLDQLNHLKASATNPIPVRLITKVVAYEAERGVVWIDDWIPEELYRCVVESCGIKEKPLPAVEPFFSAIAGPIPVLLADGAEYLYRIKAELLVPHTVVEFRGLFIGNVDFTELNNTLNGLSGFQSAENTYGDPLRALFRSYEPHVVRTEDGRPVVAPLQLLSAACITDVHRLGYPASRGSRLGVSLRADLGIDFVVTDDVFCLWQLTELSGDLLVISGTTKTQSAALFRAEFDTAKVLLSNSRILLYNWATLSE